jgi:hypothetical protein
VKPAYQIGVGVTLYRVQTIVFDIPLTLSPQA